MGGESMTHEGERLAKLDEKLEPAIYEFIKQQECGLVDVKRVVQKILNDYIVVLKESIEDLKKMEKLGIEGWSKVKEGGNT